MHPTQTTKHNNTIQAAHNTTQNTPKPKTKQNPKRNKTKQHTLRRQPGVFWVAGGCSAAAVQHNECCAVMWLKGGGHAACGRKISSTAGSKADQLHLATLRRLLGVQQGKPIAGVLAEAGERYLLWQRWLLRAVKLWNLAVTAEQSSLLWQAI
jgi:hypothetical protein